MPFSFAPEEKSGERGGDLGFRQSTAGEFDDGDQADGGKAFEVFANVTFFSQESMPPRI